MAQREYLRIAVTPEAYTAVEKMCDQFGMTKQELASRMYMWLVDQDEIVQTSVLGLLPDSVEGPAAEIYMEKVRNKRAKAPHSKRAKDD